MVGKRRAVLQRAAVERKALIFHKQSSLCLGRGVVAAVSLLSRCSGVTHAETVPCAMLGGRNVGGFILPAALLFCVENTEKSVEHVLDRSALADGRD